MGNLCTTTQSANERRRKPDSRRKGSGSTTGFSPTEDLAYEQNTGAAASGSGAATNGLRTGPVSTSEVDLHPGGAGTGGAQERAADPANGDPPLNRSRRGSSNQPAATGEAGDGGSPEREDTGGGGGGGERESRRRRDSSSRGKDGDERRRSSRRSSKSSRKDGEGKSSRGREKGGGSSRRRDGERGSQGDQSGRRPRSERTEKEIAERKERRERERAARNGGNPETEEARRERKERRERRKRKEAEAAEAAAAAEAASREGATAGTDAGMPEEGAAATAAATAATGGGASVHNSNGSAGGGLEGSGEHRRDRKSKSKKEGRSSDSRYSNSGGGGGGSRERGSAGASGVMAGSGGSAAGSEHHEKKKKSSGLRKMYDSLTGGFSGSAAMQSNGGSAGGGASGGGGGGPAGAGGGGGGGTSGRGGSAGRSSRSSGGSRNQLVTSVTSRDVREKYEIERSQLGHGHYGVVRRCWDKSTREGFAIKTIKKSKVSRIESLRREIEILRCVNHPCIIKLYDVYEDDRFIHLVTELCTGGELFDRIIQKTESEEGHYSEKDAKVVVSSILSGIAYCHNEHNICHRDLKPENFLFKRPDSDTEIKIIDFGLSRFEDMQTAMTTRVGTPYYIAPEVLSRKYDKACDLWSIGVITYILLAGYPPFYGESDQEIFASVRHGYFDFPSPEWDNISPQAKDFITQLLQKDPAARMTATQSINHGWFDAPSGGGAIEEDSASGRGSGAGDQVNMQRINHRLRRFVRMSKLKKVALNVIAQQLTEAEIGHLRGVFELLDTQNKGVIGPDELRQVVQQDGVENADEDVLILLQGIDIDGSNSLNYREFLAATMERNIFIREQNIRCAFDYFDLDGNSEITLQNLVKIFGAEEHAREIMGDVNLSGEGAITYDEFKTMMMDMPLDGRDQMTPRTPRTPRFTLRT